jgi:hypothetical protein
MPLSLALSTPPDRNCWKHVGEWNGWLSSERHLTLYIMRMEMWRILTAIVSLVMRLGERGEVRLADLSSRKERDERHHVGTSKFLDFTCSFATTNKHESCQSFCALTAGAKGVLVLLWSSA